MNEPNELAELSEKIAAYKSLPDPDTRKELRERVNLTQSDLAKSISVAPSSIAKYEAGTRTPRGDILIAYVKLLEWLKDQA